MYYAGNIVLSGMYPIPGISVFYELILLMLTEKCFARIAGRTNQVGREMYVYTRP